MSTLVTFDGDRAKVPPHSIQAEQSLLGGLLLDNRAWDQVADLVTEADFYRREHRLIFTAAGRLIERGDPCDVITLSEWLDSQGDLEDVGGLAYIGTLAKDTPSAANIRAYAAIVRDKSLLRGLVIVAGEIANAAYEANRSAVTILDDAQARILSIGDHRHRHATRDLSEQLAELVDEIDARSRSVQHLVGLLTGFTDIDATLCGLESGQLVIIAGRPSMGKTTFAMNIAEHAAIKDGRPVAVFSMEMPAKQLLARAIASTGGVPLAAIRTGKLDDDDWPRLTSAVAKLSEAPLFIDDTPALSPTELRARARRLKREHDLALIVIDYLQLMQVPGHKENRTGEISEISRSLKALAKELNVPVIALSQLNRSLEQRPSKRPVMSDLRESGAIEQDADVIIFIYRDEVYDEDSPDKGTAEIIIGKQRNGPIGMHRLTFLGEYTRFNNFTPRVDWDRRHEAKAARPVKQRQTGFDYRAEGGS